jgi:hypothetical protein
MKGSGVNETHYTLTALCNGCSQWGDASAQTKLNPMGVNTLAWARAKKPVNAPANNASTFNVHSDFDHWSHDFSLAQSEMFDTWVRQYAGGVPDATSLSSSTLPTGTVVPPSSSLVPSSSSPGNGMFDLS